MKYTRGNILKAEAQAIVNTVNTAGVMGKGIALQFRERYPANFKEYARQCRMGLVQIGKMLVTIDNSIEGEKIIINFPTKTEWFKKSQYSYIEEGLKDLVRVIEEYKIKSIAIPPLGCGNGGLNWNKVKILMESYLSKLKDVDIMIYEPNDEVKLILQNEVSVKEKNLTNARAMLLFALFRYERLGEIATPFAANKLAYFLQKTGEPLKLQFVPYLYGPYSQAVEKVLYALNGKYLSGMEQMNAGPFEPLKLNYLRYGEVEEYINKNLSPEQTGRLSNLFNLIEGFESTLALEILATTHFVKSSNPELTEEQLYGKIQSWSNRKRELIKKEYISLALKHLKSYENQAFSFAT